MPRERRITRQTSKKSQESDDQTDSFDECTSQDEGNTTLREREARNSTMEEELLQLRKELEAAKAAASKEKQERLRYEQLLQEQQVISSASIPNSAVMSGAPEITAVTSAVFTPVFAISTATTVPYAVGQDNFIHQQTATTGHTPCSSHASYSWPPVSSSPPPQITSANSVHRQQSSTPTFLPPLYGLQTIQRQHQIATSAAEQPHHPQGPSLSPAAYGSQRKLHDLPEFRGRPEEWPMFCTAFVESTNMFGYSKVENMFRLHKSLRGEARDVVESLLIHPNNVDEVMASLEFRFGRPECLVQSQLKKVRSFTPIPDNKLELIVPFATKVQNLTVFLEASGMHQHLANPTLLDELVGKLPMNKRLEWAQCSVCIRPYPTVKHFSEWINRVARLVCIVSSSQLPSSSQSDSSRKTMKGNVLHAVEVKEKVGNSKCRYCEGTSHAVTECSTFTKLHTPAKWDFVKRHNLCFGCLKFGHNVKTCRTKRSCTIGDCRRMHHQSLHESESPTKSSAGASVGLEPRRPLLSCDDNRSARILFKVLPIRIYNKEAMVRTFALLDEGSSVTIMSSELAKRLHLSGKPKDLHLRWIGDKPETKRSFAVDVEVSADEEDAKRFKLSEVQTVEELCLPTQTFATSDLFLHSRPDISLPNYKDARPEILIGLDNSHLGAPIEIVYSEKKGPIAVRTQLGWVAYGALPSGHADEPRGNVVLCSSHERERDVRLDKLVEEYFCIESFGVRKPTEKPVSQSDKRASHLLSSTTKRLDKRYQTGLLWKEDGVQLPNSYGLATKRLFNLEARMRRDPDFGATYKENIASYVKKGYAVKLTRSEAGTLTPRTWYLPHFGVKNPNKPGKVRLVFDAAAEVEGVSLNSALLKGPDNIVPLVKVLFNFRIRPFAVTGDIREMFHQVLIRPEDEHSQRFLWREEAGMPIDTYVMKVMTFGAACSPCSANYIKNLNAERFRNEHPRATEAIVKHHYVDDYVDSFESVSEAITVTKAVIAIHRDAGFELRNFTSNSKEVLHSLSHATETCSSIQTISLDMEAAIADRVLGLCWNSEEDVFMFRMNFARVSQDVITGNRCPTKREFLSLTMSVFDPLGMIANYTLPLKLILKSIWRLGIGWDEPIPAESLARWKEWKSQMATLTALKIPRCHSHFTTRADRVDLHTFVDASEEAFSAATYLRIEHHGEVHVSFVCGKTRVSPNKLLTIPRLELSAAILGMRLCNSVVECHTLPIADRIYWSDSKTVLHWLRSDPSRHKEFVAYRIAEILQSSKVNQWRWVPSKSNPADDATRGGHPLQFHSKSKWISGPAFLRLPETEWPQQPDDFCDHLSTEEIRPKYLLSTSRASKPIFDATRFSSFLKLRRTMAWALRFISACRRQPKEPGELAAAELKEAEDLVCRQAQCEAYGEDIECLRQDLPIRKGSQLHKMTPYLDEFGLVRSLGRIDAATTVPFETRRPIIMPRDHAVTKLLVSDYHRRLRHQNDDTIVNEIRQRFWVPGLRSAVKAAKGQCQFCRIRRTKPQTPLMGQLPEDRVTPFVRPFTFTGLDYFGPVNVAIGRRTEKRWVALFTCLTVRAIHLEIAADLSTDACILCIRNFVNRRGTPLRIRTDNGTNFLGASKELLTGDIFDNEAIKAELSSVGIEWVFNCPLNPHAGGCWERLVQSTKRALAYTLKEVTPKIEVLYSALMEAENIINSRPLTHLPITTEDEEPLTPNHFLLGVPNSTQTPGPMDERALCLRKRWKVSQQLKNRFWNRWVREYLPVLTKRCKWFQRTPPLKVGDLVLDCDVTKARSGWTRGRIIKVFPGPDGQVRSADVRTASGVLRRPAVRLARLEVSEAGVSTRAPHGGWDVDNRDV